MAEMHDFMVHLAENKDALRTLTDGELMTMPPHDTVFDDILFNPGERIIMPPDENGHYSEDAIPSPQELLKQLFEDPARLGGLEPPTLGSEDRYSIH